MEMVAPLTHVSVGNVSILTNQELHVMMETHVLLAMYVNREPVFLELESANVKQTQTVMIITPVLPTLVQIMHVSIPYYLEQLVMMVTHVLLMILVTWEYVSQARASVIVKQIQIVQHQTHVSLLNV